MLLPLFSSFLTRIWSIFMDHLQPTKSYVRWPEAVKQYVFLYKLNITVYTTLQIPYSSSIILYRCNDTNQLPLQYNSPVILQRTRVITKRLPSHIVTILVRCKLTAYNKMTPNDPVLQYAQSLLIKPYLLLTMGEEWYFKLSYRFEIWQAHRQHCCRDVCQISERSDDSKYKSRGFETLRDLTERRLFGYWDGALRWFGRKSKYLVRSTKVDIYCGMLNIFLCL